MAFCINCGKELDNDAKFCANCGKAVNDNSNAQRKTVYEGELHKCPNCGEVLNSFVANCPLCGCEIRGASNSEAIKDFANKLAFTTTIQGKISVIRNFPVPNTKEDIMEFMILASSNCDKSQGIEVIEAWVAKMSQCMQKAKMFVVGDSLLYIQKYYHDTIKRAKRQCFVLKVNSFIKGRMKHDGQKYIYTSQSRKIFGGNLLSSVTKTIFKNICVFVSLMAFYQTIQMDVMGDDVSGAGFVLLGAIFLIMSTLLVWRKSVTYGDILITIVGIILTFRLSGKMGDENGAATLFFGAIAVIMLIPAFIKKLMQKQ